MKRDLLDMLCCAHCRAPLKVDASDAADGSVARGTLECTSCGILVPIERGFPFFTLADVLRSETRAVLGDPADYERYMERKFERGEIEMYAAFHPFNESLRAAEPILPLLARSLKPGDIILEPWARTGWTAAWLAALFPEQRVIALWEGDTSVLGYRGFAHWFAQGRRPDNLELMFVHPDRGLPFPDESIAAIFSHDCFHRFGVDTFAAEILRVAAPTAPIVLAHVHLSNSEPDPWFDRGGTIRHGTAYRDWLGRVTHGTSRSGRIWSEGDLFCAWKLPPDDPETSHYNALILIADENGGATPPRLHAGNDRLLLNPLYKLHGGRSSAQIDANHLDGLVGHMLVRHPVYRPRLSERPLPLSDGDWLIISEALCGTEIDALPEAIGVEPAIIEERLARLRQYDLLLPVCASDELLRLQRFHANQLPPARDFLDLVSLTSSATLSGEELSLSGEELRESLELIGSALSALGVGQGTSVQIGKFGHPIAFLAMLASIALAADVVLCADVEDLVLESSEGCRELPLGLDGAHDGLLAAIEASKRTTLAAVGTSACIHFGSLDGPAIAAHRFLEAAGSLKHALAKPCTIERLATVSDWLSVTAGLVGGLDIRIG